MLIIIVDLLDFFVGDALISYNLYALTLKKVFCTLSFEYKLRIFVWIIFVMLQISICKI